MRKLGFLLALVTTSLLAPAAFASDSCYCAQEWIWGGCAVTECASTLDGSGSGGGTSGQDYDAIHFYNACSRNVQTGLRYRDVNNNWQTAGWWTLTPGQDVYVANTKNRIYYIYGETIDGNTSTRLRWDGSDFHDKIHGSSETYGFHKREITTNDWGTWTQRFNCDGIGKYKALVLAWANTGAWATRAANFVNDATNDALNACKSSNNNNACSVAMTLQPASRMCMAVVGKGNALWSASNADINAARTQALNNCGGASTGCAVRWSACND